MQLQTPKLFNIFELKGCHDIPAGLVDAELEQAEQRLETWINKSYYQKVASLALIADRLPDQTSKLSLFIKAEIEGLLAQSNQEITLL